MKAKYTTNQTAHTKIKARKAQNHRRLIESTNYELNRLKYYRPNRTYIKNYSLEISTQQNILTRAQPQIHHALQYKYATMNEYTSNLDTIRHQNPEIPSTLAEFNTSKHI